MKDKIQMIVFVLVLGSILTTALVSVDAFTKPRIEENMKKKLEKSLLEAAGIEFTEENRADVFASEMRSEEFPNELQDEGAAEKDRRKFYVTKSGKIVFEYRGSGLQDEIYGAIAFDKDLETIKGITIVKQAETPGLGGRITEAQFLNQFKDKRITIEGGKIISGLKITGEGKASGEYEVNGMTGATMSCNAFEKVLNSESEKYIPAIKESLK